MKSIMQEAATIAKAIEKAWNAAGKPQEFSVKVFEQEEKNFLGFTSKPAKIGLFFDQKGVPGMEAPVKRVSPIAISKSEARKVQKKTFAQEMHEEIKEPKDTEAPAPAILKKQKRVLWTDEMVALARDWMQGALDAMDKGDVPFTHKINNYYLRFSFAKPLAPVPEKERQLFRNLSFLLLQALKKQLKRSLHGFKVVLVQE